MEVVTFMFEKDPEFQNQNHIHSAGPVWLPELSWKHQTPSHKCLQDYFTKELIICKVYARLFVPHKEVMQRLS